MFHGSGSFVQLLIISKKMGNMCPILLVADARLHNFSGVCEPRFNRLGCISLFPIPWDQRGLQNIVELLNGPFCVNCQLISDQS
ncbi:hypothetical protein BV95_01433 [Sphingobium chlorophenolicum]|uniref:Uncharacterized protein n=1 Tax=Sphingobium chlorophenolicum TaxID=46429 RepID=A0A081RGP5_SPHCR|nr:hypothetical protein BV95_01433 [Sphingobium chlorophenolicum]